MVQDVYVQFEATSEGSAEEVLKRNGYAGICPAQTPCLAFHLWTRALVLLLFRFTNAKDFCVQLSAETFVKYASRSKFLSFGSEITRPC